MRTAIGPFRAIDRSVTVTFTDDGFSHTRHVTAALDEHGAYDAAGTAARVDQVAAGVAHKRDLGLFDKPGTPA
ncbi:MAG: hypothetical protein JO290_12515 [Sphingomonadaceae bacterium]|nr:hypothetical protein [Sphingomonadaceae bacterium]